MKEWWDSLSLLAQIFYTIAIPATVIMVIQSLMMFLGMGFDSDTDGAGGIGDDVDGTSDGLSLITVRGMVAFFAVGGWTGIVVLSYGAQSAVAIIISFIAGLIALFVVAWLFKLAMKLQDSGNLNTENAIGKNARVYIPIPSNKAGYGKVTLVVQDRYIELDAMTTESRDLKTGEIVKVIELIDNQTVLVESRGDDININKKGGISKWVRD